MSKATEDPIQATDGADASWRDRALERSLRTAKAKAMSRSDGFIATAMELLQETGRTDFTVQELVDRSRTSLRSFYQYFAGKDELLLALLEESIARSVRGWRKEIEGKDAISGLRVVVRSIYGVGDDPSGGLNRGLAPYHFNLAESHRADYQRAHSPMARLIHELVARGIDEGSIRTDIPADKLARVFIQSVIGSALFTALARSDFDRTADRSVDAETMWEFCRRGLMGTAGLNQDGT